MCFQQIQVLTGLTQYLISSETSDSVHKLSKNPCTHPDSIHLGPPPFIWGGPLPPTGELSASFCQKSLLIEMGLELAASDTELAKYIALSLTISTTWYYRGSRSHQPHCRGASLHKGPGTFFTDNVLIRGVTNSHLVRHQVTGEVRGRRSSSSCELYDSW